MPLLLAIETIVEFGILRIVQRLLESSTAEKWDSKIGR